MGVLQSLSCLVLKQAVHAVTEAAGIEAVGASGEALVGFLTNRFTDHSQRLQHALQRANERAWKALEIALAGDSWWDRCKVALASGQEKGFRAQVQAFLDATPLPGLAGGSPEFCHQALRQLQAARKAGVLTRGNLEPKQLAQQAGAFARFGDPTSVLDAEWKAVDEMSGELREYGYPVLAQLMALRPPKGPPLLVAAARYFFGREVETDRELFQGLAFARMERLTQAQEAGFNALAGALDKHADRLEELLGDVRAVVIETRGDVLDMKAELQRQGQQMQELGKAVLQALQQHQLEKRELHAGDSLSLRGDTERRLVKDLVARYRSLPEKDRRRLPALLNAVGKLEVVSGDFEAAQRDFQEVATLVPDAKARAEAHFNCYQAALERRTWPEALSALKEGARLDPARFAPFPLDKFEPERILGAGGFGVAFLCRNRHSGSRVVVKTLRGESLDRDVVEVFREAQVLEDLEHPAIIRVRDCDYADTARMRPYVVMDYFPGQTLAEHVEQQGPVPAEHLVPLACLVGEGLQKAHAKGILHRDVKPANLLVRQVPGERGATTPRWEVKLIDFGLALRSATLHSTARSHADRTVTGSSIAGTIDYAAPEQMGRLANTPVGPYSDVYGFAKTCCYALFCTPQPTFQHWQKLDPALAELLGQCLAEHPKDRPADFNVVVNRLSRLKTSAVPVVLEAMPAAVLPDALPVVRPKHSSRSSTRKRHRREEDWDQKAPTPRRKSGLWVLLPLLAPILAGGGLVLWGVLGQHGGSGDWHPPEMGVKSLASLPPPKPLSAEELAKIPQDWKTATREQQGEMARRLAVTTPDPKNREEIARDLVTLLKGQDKVPRVAAAGALGTWGEADAVPELIRVLQDPKEGWDGDVRIALIKTLGDLKDPRGIKPIVERLKAAWDREQSAKSLAVFGSDAEDALIEALNAPSQSVEESGAKRTICDLLGRFGTAKSITPLEKAAASTDPFLKQDAQKALTAVKARK
jgi:serine/threonine protein kinase